MENEGKEIGGTHYSDMKIEPVELITALDLDFVQGCIVKYVSRYKNKNGVEDLLKARHYCIIGKQTPHYIEDRLDSGQALMLKMYCMLNGIEDAENMIIGYAIIGDYDKCSDALNELIVKLVSKTELA